MRNLILFVSCHHLNCKFRGRKEKWEKVEREKKKKSEGKEVKTKTARAALAVGHLLQPLPQY